MSGGRLMWGRGRRSSPDLSVCLLFGICWSTQHDRFNLLIALCVSGTFSDFVCFSVCARSALCVHFLCAHISNCIHIVYKCVWACYTCVDQQGVGGSVERRVWGNFWLGVCIRCLFNPDPEPIETCDQPQQMAMLPWGPLRGSWWPRTRPHGASSSVHFRVVRDRGCSVQ